MELIAKKSYIKAYEKLSRRDKKKVDQAIELFKINPFHPLLRNHELKGQLAGARALSAAFDLRIHFEVIGDYVVVYFINVGTHNQVY